MVSKKKLDEDTIAARIQIKEMIVDEYQGHVNKGLVEHIAANWDDDAAGAVILNLRDDNSYAVLDGQHRVLAAKIVGIDALDALVHIGKTKPEEAALFVQLNHKHNVRPMDRFRANLVAGCIEEKNIRKALNEVGLDVALKGASRVNYGAHIQCPGTLVDIYSGWGLSHFKTVVGIVSAAYKAYDDPKAYVSEVFGGVSQFVARYPQADIKRAIDKLSERSPVVMLGMSEMKRERGQENAVGWGKALTSLYNTGYRAGSKMYLPVEVWNKKLLSPAGRKAREESVRVREQLDNLHEVGKNMRFTKGHTPHNKGLKLAAKSKKA